MSSFSRSLIERPRLPADQLLDATLNRMTLLRRGNLISASLLAMFSILLIGCASPGPPQPPSLRVPQPVRDLAAQRLGGRVELRFTVPWQSTDKLPLRRTNVRGVLCRESDRQGCIAIAGLTPSRLGPLGEHNLFTWDDILPPTLSSGPPRLLSYRVEFFNDAGRSAGRSEPAYTIAGSAPPSVTGLHAEGSRLGVVLSWTSVTVAEGQVLLQREDMAPHLASAENPKATTLRKGKQRADSNILWLETHGNGGRTVDTTAEAGAPYRYTAVRQRMAQLGGLSLPYRSGESLPVTITLQQIYPPQAPSGLTATGFASGGSGSFAVDLIWQPIDDGGLLAGLAGYNVYREPLDVQGHSTGNHSRLNPTPDPLPSFHDATAQSGLRYRYGVTAVDNRGNESPADIFVLEPLPQ